MLRLVIFLLGIAVVATGLSWLADRPGSLLINWQGYEVETSVFRAVVMLAFLVGLSILAWSIITALWRSPASVGMFFNRRRQVRGLEALSGGMIAIGAGDRDTATRFAVQARKALPNEPLTHLLRAQAAQLSGDRTTARRMFEAMLAQPETEQLGLRGLFLEAEREGEREAARQFAERSVELNPKLGWAVDALFDLQCKDNDWAGALQTLGIAKKHQHHDKIALDRRRAVLMTARAMALEETEPNRAMSLAIEAHHLAHDLVPAAVLAGRMLAARGHTKRAAKIVERAWRRHPHPDLAMVYAHVRIGDSPSDRLARVRRLAPLHPHSIETPLAIASAAVEAKEWALARQELSSLDAARTTQRVCTLMARIESEESADKGRAREWLVRAVHAPRDAAWVADGVVSDKWAPVSPVTGAFDAFQWRVPADALDAADTDLIAAKLQELVKLSAPVAEAPMPAPALDADDGEGSSGMRGTAHRAARTAFVPVREPEANDIRTSGSARRDGVASQTAVPVRPDGLSLPSSILRAGAGAGEASIVEVKPVETRPGNGVKPAVASVAKVVPAAAAAGVSSPAGDGDKKVLEPGMFIAPSSQEDTGVAKVEGDEPRKPAVRVVASGQR